MSVVFLSGQVLASDNSVKPPTAKTALKTLNKAHPRLILTDKRLAELKESMKRDPLLKKCYKDILKQADKDCAKKPLVHHLRDGVRLLSVSRECISRIYTLALAWRLTGDEKYAQQAKENLLTVCAFADWNPKHFLDTAEMSHAVGIGYDWLLDWLDADSREKIRTGLIANGLEPGLALYEGEGVWQVTTVFNWNLVCNGGLTIGALAVAETDPKYAEVIIPGAVKFLPNALSTYAPDGAWPEGPGYWRYATNYAVYGLAALDTALGTDFGLSEVKGLSEAGLFPICMTGPTGVYFNFADTGRNLGRSRRKNLPCFFWLASRYDKPVLARAEREMLTKHGGSPMDFIWYVPARKKPLHPKLDKRFRGPVEVAVFRSAWDDPNALFLAVKAGYNQVGHAHLDLGNFEIDALGVRWASDLGKENYNLPGYWDHDGDAKRWTYYRISSFSHNVPVLGGKNQDVYAETKITKFKTTPEKGFAVLDLTSAYKDFAKKVTRGVAIVGNRSSVLIQDEFEITKPCEVAWGMTTDAKISVAKDKAVLTIGDKKMTAQILSPAGATFTVESAEQKPPLNANKGVNRLMVRLNKQKGNVRIAVFLVPDRPEAQQPAKPPTIKPLKQW